MMRLDSLAEHLGVAGGTDYLFQRAVIDSRKAGPGTVFFALTGTRTDGHLFVESALSAGAGAVVSRPGHSGPVLKVPNVENALLEAGRWARARFSCPVAAITGSSGKTTTRELLLLALGARMKAEGTRGNLNNRLGLPLTLMNASSQVSALVVELGMNHAGELLELGEVASPDVTVITNIGTAHIEYFSDRDGIAAAKAELLRTTRRGGNAVIPRGEPILLEAARERDLRVVTTGPGGDAWVEDGVLMPWGVRPNLAIPGEHNLQNALSAMAAAVLFGVEPGLAVVSMEGYQGMEGRGRILHLRGVTVFDESYNANPESVSACLRLLDGAGQRGVAVLGDMLELGGRKHAAHEAVLDEATGMGLRRVILVGPLFREALDRRRDPGVLWAPDAAGALELLKDALREGDRVLVKGSHALALETVVRGIQEGMD